MIKYERPTNAKPPLTVVCHNETMIFRLELSNLKQKTNETINDILIFNAKFYVSIRTN
jgi:hypothetical protein